MAERTLRLVGSDRSRAAGRLPLIALALDATLATLVGALAVRGREQLEIFTSTSGIQEQLGLAGPLMVVSWLALIAARGGYRRVVFGNGPDEFRRVSQATLLGAGAVGVACYLVKFDLSRGFFMLAFLLGLPTLLLGRWCLRQVMHWLRRHGHLVVYVLVSGSLESIDEVTRVLRRERWLGYHVIGAVTPQGEYADETEAGVPVLGTADRVTEVAVAHDADIIFFASGSLTSAQELREKVWELEEPRINVVIAPSLDDIASGRIKVRPVGGLPLIHVDRPTWANASNVGKRLFDLVGSAVLVVVLSPVFLVASLQIWLDDRGPLLYRQTRIGRHANEFACLKFRTMTVDADARIPELIESNDTNALLFKMKDDPRITKPGRWLRRYSIDELPQLFNVLRGEMSLVGPRPQVQREVDLYEGGMIRRLLVRPGMTGLWQVSGRSDLSPEEAMRLDLFYVDNWSMTQDVGILGRTVGAVLGSRGAY